MRRGEEGRAVDGCDVEVEEEEQTRGERRKKSTESIDMI